MKISDLYKLFLKYPKVSTDSRKKNKNCIFFSLSGPNFNGNKFAIKALKNGASYAIVSDKNYALNNKYIVVENTLETLQDLAKFHRKKLKIPFIAITGTNGKTTSKELIYKCLQKKLSTGYTKGNLNNHIGVPLTILTITKEHEIAVIEMGANHPGEIKKLCEITQPNYGVITNIGLAHLEGFKSLEGVQRAKKELYDYIKLSNGSIFINNEDKFLNTISTDIKRISYGTSGDFSGNIESSNPFININYKNSKIKSNLSGNYQFYNIMLSICIAEYFKIKKNDIIKAISEYTPSNNRSQIIKTTNNKILLDAYNANPSSMTAAINSFASDEISNKVLIIGDMFELGDHSTEEHKKIIDLTIRTKIKSFFIGSNFKNHNTKNSYETIEKFIETIKEKPITDCFIFMKGSRGIALEKLVKYL
jgi:UDP-N-acetylmuramoyl-tripeptide--D-alanyl-D-alanine ligase